VIRCWAYGLFGTPCTGRGDSHHLIKQQWLKREGLTKEQQNDPRVLRRVCRAHHQAIHSPTFHLWRHQFPRDTIEYAKEHDILFLIDKADIKRRQTEDRRLGK
jgi:hypothetical protein